MALLEILEFPDARLRTKATPMAPEEIQDPSLQTMIDNMLETMYDAPGIGLAASQINYHKRLVVIDVSDEGDDPMVFINPEVEPLTEEQETMKEGCLSVPGFYEEVTRPERVRVNAIGRDGKAFTMEAEGLLAVCIQHELDHLEGKLFVDYISPLKRTRIRKKLEKQHKQAASA
ncbi:peptide deformylase [Pokkaliibacter sp. CJK22405]|uniref:peptide deformylase n=1 Tax=Pokkaliibacter sp. CJK22405 TaxID=3384615 RepID=UPI0039847524